MSPVRFISLSNRGIRRPLPSLRLILILTVFLTGTSVTGVYIGFRMVPPIQLQRFNSFAELSLFLNTHRANLWGGGSVPASFEAGWGLLAASSAGSTAGYSTTNIQVEGVDEPDHVKTDGTYIYTITESEVVIVRAYKPEDAGVIKRFQPVGQPLTLFLYDSSHLVVISTIYSDDSSWPRPTDVGIEVFDINEPAIPQLSQRVTVEGEYVGARLIESHLYLLTSSWVTDENGTIVLPSVDMGGVERVIPANTIYYDAGTYDNGFRYTLALGLDIADPEAVPTIETFLGGTSCSVVYTSLTNLYIACTRYPTFPWNWRMSNTVIHRFKIAEGHAAYKTSGQVPGYLINQFALDEFRGHLRVATTSWTPSTSENDQSSQTWTQASNVFILNLHLDIQGRLEGLAPGEQIYSVRFMEETGYLVTFYKTDPLFVIDLNNPTQPQLLGELEVTGYSDYLHPLDDQHLLGIGKDVAVSQDNDWWWYQGVKLSIFDVTDRCNPLESLRLVLGVRGTESEILHDHKAILIDTARNLLVIPLLLAEHPENTTDPPPHQFGDYIWQGAAVFHLNHTTDTLSLQGQISHITNTTALTEDHWDCRPYFVNRMLYIGNVLYTLSRYKLSLHDLGNLNPISDIIIDPSLGPLT